MMTTLGSTDVSAGEVSSLGHESSDHTVELGSDVSLTDVGVLTELTEVTGSLGNDIVVQLEDNTSPVGTYD